MGPKGARPIAMTARQRVCSLGSCVNKNAVQAPRLSVVAPLRTQSARPVRSATQDQKGAPKVSAMGIQIIILARSASEWPASARSAATKGRKTSDPTEPRYQMTSFQWVTEINIVRWVKVKGMGHPLTLISVFLLLLGGCVAGRREVVTTPVRTVAETSDIRSWMLKAYWAERQNDLPEARRCMEWVLRLAGDDPEVQRAVDAFTKRHGLTL